MRVRARTDQHQEVMAVVQDLVRARGYETRVLTLADRALLEDEPRRWFEGDDVGELSRLEANALASEIAREFADRESLGAKRRERLDRDLTRMLADVLTAASPDERTLRTRLETMIAAISETTADYLTRSQIVTLQEVARRRLAPRHSR